MRASVVFAIAVTGRSNSGRYRRFWDRFRKTALRSKADPYFAEQIVEFMEGTEQLILVGASPPASFFAYPNKPSWCTPEDLQDSLSRASK